jgi:Acetyltransferase (GNAT) domain
MISYFLHNEINRNKWDSCIENSVFETIYPYAWYLDLVSPGWEGLVMGDYEAVFPVTWKKKYGIRYVVQPVLSQQLGVFSPVRPSRVIIESFMRMIPDRYKHIDICLNSSNEISNREFRILRRKNYELWCGDKSANPEQVYSENTRRNLRKALQNNIQIRQTDIDDYIDLRRISDATAFRPDHYKYLNRLFSGIIDKGRGEIAGAYCNDKLCAAIFWAFSKTRVIYLNAVSNEAGKNKRAMFLLVDHYIKKYQGQEKIIDFEGSMIPGIARFFQGFGAKEIYYTRIIKSSFPLNLKKVVK